MNIANGTASRLRQVRTSDYSTIYAAEICTMPNLVRYRHRGIAPPPEQFSQSLWGSVLVQFVVEDGRSGEACGMVTCYSADFRNQNAKLALLAFNSRVWTRAVCIDGMWAFGSYLFDTFPLRKVYMEVLEWNEAFFETGERFGMVQEGRLIEHEMHGDHALDMIIWSTTRTQFYEACEARRHGGSENLIELCGRLGIDALDRASVSRLDSIGLAEVLVAIRESPRLLLEVQVEDDREYLLQMMSHEGS